MHWLVLFSADKLCQAANWDLSDFLALRDYWTAWEPGRKYGSQCWTIDKSHWCVSAYIIGVLTSSGSAPSRVDMNYILKKSYKMNLPTDELIFSWLVSLLNCPVTYSRNLPPPVYEILHQIELLTANKLPGKYVWKTNIKGYEHQSCFLTCLNICETFFLIIFPVLVEI